MMEEFRKSIYAAPECEVRAVEGEGLFCGSSYLGIDDFGNMFW